jgi:hypothetical protein
MYLQTKPKLLPIIFITTADKAGGKATSGELKCDVANTTPNEEFCMPTCNLYYININLKLHQVIFLPNIVC